MGRAGCRGMKRQGRFGRSSSARFPITFTGSRHRGSGESEDQQDVAASGRRSSLRLGGRPQLNVNNVGRGERDLMVPESEKEFHRLAWKHIAAEEFAEAEGPIRRLREVTDPRDPLRLSHHCRLLAGVLNSLSRTDEGTEMYRRALFEALRAGASRSEVAIVRYMLANQFLMFGEPRNAIANAEPVPPGSRDVQCLLHSVVAQALWKLDRPRRRSVLVRVP
jgi:hypothetical protein